MSFIASQLRRHFKLFSSIRIVNFNELRTLNLQHFNNFLNSTITTSSLKSKMENFQHGDKSKPASYVYTEKDFIHQTPSWHETVPQKLSPFDLALHSQWDKAMEGGAFRYGIDHIITRILPGEKQYVGQLNTLRATERRKPQDITSVAQPFNEKAFNFTWVKNEEIIFDLCNVTETAKEANNGTVANNAAGAEGQEPQVHRLVINVSPMEYGHCLLAPQINCKMPQILTQTSFEVAIELMLLSNHRGFRMGFNSLCAFASVNHLHFHVYYLEHELIVDHCPVRHLGGKYYEFTALPCPGFAMQCHGSTVKEMARRAHRISSYFHKSDIAHNIFMCRGTVFGEPCDSKLTTIRLFIWPRKKFIGNKSSEEFNVACIELGGHLPIKETDGYYKLTESDVDDIIDDANLPRAQYEDIREAVTKMGLEEDQASTPAHSNGSTGHKDTGLVPSQGDTEHNGTGEVPHHMDTESNGAQISAHGVTEKSSNSSKLNGGNKRTSADNSVHGDSFL